MEFSLHPTLAVILYGCTQAGITRIRGPKISISFHGRKPLHEMGPSSSVRGEKRGRTFRGRIVEYIYISFEISRFVANNENRQRLRLGIRVVSTMFIGGEKKKSMLRFQRILLLKSLVERVELINNLELFQSVHTHFSSRLVGSTSGDVWPTFSQRQRQSSRELERQVEPLETRDCSSFRE